MSPFAQAQVRSESGSPPTAANVPLRVFLLCLLLGLAVVVWLTRETSEAAHTQARRTGAALASNLEAQFEQAFTAVEILGALARQGGGAVSNFQMVGGELLALHPTLGFLELEPGGIISQVVPRAGHERVVGLNVLQNPVQGASADATRRGRVLTVAGPFTLDHGELGIIARIPIFQRGIDGQEHFRGFVAGSLRLATAFGRAGLDKLTSQGYEYGLYAPGPGRQTAMLIPSHGRFALNDAVNQPVRARNLEFHLVLRPQAGWLSPFNVGLELLAVLAASGLIYGLTSRWQSRLLAAESVRAAAHQTEVRFAAEKAQLEQSLRSAEESKARYETGLKQAESRATHLQAQLDAGARSSAEAAQSRQIELDRAHEELHKTRQTIQELKNQIEEISNAGRKARTAAQDRLQQEQTAKAELQRRLDLAARVAKESAELHANKVRALEERNQELTQRLRAAEQKATDLTALLQEAQTKPSGAPMEETGRTAKPVHLEPKPAEPQPAIELKSESLQGAIPVIATPSPDRTDVPANETLETTGLPKVEALATDNTPADLKDRTKEPLAVAIEGAATRPAKRLPARRVKDGKPQRNNQMDLFGGPTEMEKSQTPETRAGGMEKPVTGKLNRAANNPAPPPSRPTESVPLNIGQLRKAVGEILPLLADKDPGAKDCLAANRDTFRSGFSAEAFTEFEACIHSDDLGAALEHLRRAAKRHGVL